MQEETVLVAPVVHEDLLHRYFKSIWFLILPVYIVLTTIVTMLMSKSMVVYARDVMESIIQRLQDMGTVVNEGDMTSSWDMSASTFILLIAVAVIIYDAFKRKQMRKTPFQVIKVLYYISFGACILAALAFVFMSQLLAGIASGDAANFLSYIFMLLFIFLAIYAVFSFMIARFARGIEFYITVRSMKLPSVIGLVVLSVIFAAMIAYGATLIPNLSTYLPEVFVPSDSLTQLLNFYVIMLYLQAGTFLVAIVSLVKFHMFAKEIGA